MNAKLQRAAIWTRVSTHDQRELSLDAQEEAVRSVLESQGYVVRPEHVLKVDWTSMHLMACSDFQTLRSWIANGEIQAVGVLDRDRLQAQGLQRLVFLSECRENGVHVVTAQGSPMLEGPEGQMIEFALALGKERSVLRAQQGAKDGLRARAVLKGLPSVPKNPYGYAWDDGKQRLLPTEKWETARFICRSGLEGLPLRHIRRELNRMAIPSPSGREWWNIPGIYRILSNPTYGGRYYALRKEHFEPAQRRVPGYGKTSSRYKPLEDAIYLANIVVDRPPLSWSEWLEIQKRLSSNKLQAMRHAKRDYLLRSRIICEAHRRRYHGQPHNSTWRYTCPARGEHSFGSCTRPFLPGPGLEASIKAVCRRVLESPDLVDREIQSQRRMVTETKESLSRQLDALERKGARNLDTETNLLLERARESASAEAFERSIAMVKAERAWIAEEKDRIQSQLTAMHTADQAAFNLEKIRVLLGAKLGSADHPHWRLVFDALELEVLVTDKGDLEARLVVPTQDEAIALPSPARG